MARYYFKNQQIEDAEKLVTEILEKQPKYFPARMFKGEIMVAKRQFDDAAALFGQLIQEEPSSGRAYYFKGVANLGRGEARLGKADVAKAVELNPRHIKARLLLSEIYYRERSFDQALKESEAVLALEPNNFQAMLIKGNIYMYQEKFKEAQNVFEEIIVRAPKNPVGYYRLGLLYRLQKQNDLAMSNFQKALEINPNFMDVFTNVIVLLASEKDFKGAHEACDEQLAKVGDNKTARAMIYNLQGRLYQAQQDNDRAATFYQKAMAESPDFIPPYGALAGIYLAENKVDLAIEQYQTALEKNPNQAGAHMILSTIYLMQKQTDLAEKHLREALKINPDFAPAANNLAYILASREENLNEALELAQKAKAKFPDNPNIIDTLGWVYYKKGLYDNAVTEFSDGIEKLPENAELRYHLGLAYYKKGENDKARQELQKALSLNASFDGAEEAKKILSEM